LEQPGVTSRFLLALFDPVYVTALAIWLGSSVYFAFAIAPATLRLRSAESRTQFVRALFPRYYLWGAISGSVALPAFVAGPLCYHEYRGAMVGVKALVIIFGILIMIHGGNSLTSSISQAAERRDSDVNQFERLIRRAIWLTALVLVAQLFLLINFATRRA